jgi:predicted nucleic acid-binding protein
MIFLLDTNAIADLMNQNPTFASRLAAVGVNDQVITCAIVRGEVQYGIARLPPGKRKAALETQAAGVFAILPCESATSSVADQYARLRAEQDRHGLRLEQNDLWIAATAATLNATIVSRDADLRKVAAVSAVDWTA